MIETVEAMRNIDEILTVPGVEAIYVGPNDLSISLGIKPNTSDPRLDEAMVEIVAGCRRNGVVPGVHASAALCEKRIEQGFGMVTVSADIVALRKQVREDLAAARGVTAEAITSTY